MERPLASPRAHPRACKAHPHAHVSSKIRARLGGTKEPRCAEPEQLGIMASRGGIATLNHGRRLSPRPGVNGRRANLAEPYVSNTSCITQPDALPGRAALPYATPLTRLAAARHTCRAPRPADPSSHARPAHISCVASPSQGGRDGKRLPASRRQRRAPRLRTSRRARGGRRGTAGAHHISRGDVEEDRALRSYEDGALRSQEDGALRSQEGCSELHRSAASTRSEVQESSQLAGGALGTHVASNEVQGQGGSLIYTVRVRADEGILWRSCYVLYDGSAHVILVRPFVLFCAGSSLINTFLG